MTSSQYNLDQKFINSALRLARKHQGLTGTNPSVGCILVKDLGFGPVIVGSGVTALGGRPHAEPPAIEMAGENAAGATAYVTLEPCAHHGKTPPCAQTLIDAGIKRIVTAIMDPDNRVNGQGHAMMADAGIEVCLMDGGPIARRLLSGYLSARRNQRCFVSLKLAMTKSGIMGSHSQGNVKISGEVSNRQTHLARARHDAILVGTGTALCDDPMLTCRLHGMANRSPLRVVLDYGSKLTGKERILETAVEFPTIVAGNADAPQEWLDMIRKAGAYFMPCDIHNGQIALPELLDDLYARGIQSIMVEGGAKLAHSLLEEEFVDEIIVHQPVNDDVVGEIKDAVIAPLTISNPPLNFEIVQTLQFGDDTSFRLLRGAE